MESALGPAYARAWAESVRDRRAGRADRARRRWTPVSRRRRCGPRSGGPSSCPPRSGSSAPRSPVVRRSRPAPARSACRAGAGSAATSSTSRPCRTARSGRRSTRAVSTVYQAPRAKVVHPTDQGLSGTNPGRKLTKKTPTFGFSRSVRKPAKKPAPPAGPAPGPSGRRPRSRPPRRVRRTDSRDRSADPGQVAGSGDLEHVVPDLAGLEQRRQPQRRRGDPDDQAAQDTRRRRRAAAPPAADESAHHDQAVRAGEQHDQDGGEGEGGQLNEHEGTHCGSTGRHSGRAIPEIWDVLGDRGL